MREVKCRFCGDGIGVFHHNNHVAHVKKPLCEWCTKLKDGSLRCSKN